MLALPKALTVTAQETVAITPAVYVDERVWVSGNNKSLR